ncbi:MAG TPA: CHASE3 domain-containing protein [Rhizomicrobium sp.]|nr:CHASE3 domain-containing protein [Rhizomicrobium sp.]
MAANRWILLASVPLFLVLAGVVYLTVLFAQGERTEQGWVIHTYQVIDSLRTLLSDAADAETGQRGYLLTKKDSFLAPYRSAEGRIESDLDRFQFLTRDNPDQQRRAAALRQLLKGRLKILDRGLASGALATPVPAPLMALLEQGKATMDTLRSMVSLGLGEELHLLTLRTEQRHATERAEIVAAVLAVLLALGVLLAAAFLLARNNARLVVSEAIRRRQASILQATLDNIRDGILVFDERDRVAAFNNVFFRLMDFPERLAAIGATLDTFKDFDGEKARRAFGDVAISNGDGRFERFARGERDLDVYRAAVPGAGFLVAAADVTARVRAEATLRQAQKMEAVGHLTGGVAHDFNNLLQIISANLDLAAADARTDPKTAERLQNAISAVERGSRLTGQLLAFARRQALDPRAINLGRLLHGMTDLLRRTLGERIEIEAIDSGGLWNTLVDPTQVENAILNLAINARDAMPDGGKLTLEVANAYLDDSYAAQHVEVNAGQYVMLAVSDTGIGMPPEVVARVFDPFFTTKPEGKGTGLGLSQVFGFVKQSGGHVKVYSEPGQGTTVKLYLPRTRKAQEGLGPVVTTDIVGGSETILVVEDDAGVRAAVVDILADLGYAVLKAESAEQGLAVISSGARIDLLFTDVVMPGPINTRDFARRAQELRPGLKVLYTSGYTQNAIVHNGRLDEDAFLLSKPYRKDDLARKLRSLLDGGPAPARPTEAAAAAEAVAAAASEGARRRILVVEDVALIRMTTVDMVQELGYDTAEAGDGAEALTILQTDPAIAILLTDLGLPGMNGRQLVAEALRLRPDLKVIIASGYSTEDEVGGAQADILKLTKPFDMNALRRALAGV